MYIIWKKSVRSTENNNGKNTKMGACLTFSKNSKIARANEIKKTREECGGNHRGMVGPELTTAKTLSCITS